MPVVQMSRLSHWSLKRAETGTRHSSFYVTGAIPIRRRLCWHPCEDEGDVVALDWVAAGNIRVIDLTTHGVLALCFIYLRLKRIEDLRTTLDQLEAGQANASPYVLFVRGAVVSSLFLQNRSIQRVWGHILDVGFARPILDEPELASRLDAAIDDLQQSIAAIRELNLPKALTNAQWYLAWASLVHPHRRAAARVQLAADMQVPELAVQRVQLAFQYLRDFDSSSIDSYIAGRELTGGLDDDDLIAAFILRTQKGDHAAVFELLTKQREISAMSQSAGGNWIADPGPRVCQG